VVRGSLESRFNRVPLSLGVLAVLLASSCREPVFHCELMGHDLSEAKVVIGELRRCTTKGDADCVRVARALGGRRAPGCFAQKRAHCFRYHSNGSYSFACTPTAAECEKILAERRADLGDYTAENCRMASPNDLK
jgi:hypothetical protein